VNAQIVETASIATAALPVTPDVMRTPDDGITVPVAEITPAPVVMAAPKPVIQPIVEPSIDEAQHRCVATAVYFESKGEPVAGQLAVARVIMNRAKSGRFASTMCGVVTQRSQFSFVRGGYLPTPPENAAWRQAKEIAKMAMLDSYAGPASSALYFHAKRVSPGWKRTSLGAIGNHIFYR
jgi:spore germination cell wall hydrolase CwlJ-like protein